MKGTICDRLRVPTILYYESQIEGQGLFEEFYDNFQGSFTVWKYNLLTPPNSDTIALKSHKKL